jgi:alkanesulfonate monooxygenase SsuD/methylene tetrahydromethanopterin reductase-like flavin-dependent oxidoreductase (luciferase family)
LFGSVFLADTLAVGDDVAHAPCTWLEPLTVLAALAGTTRRIGLIATCSTTYTEPFNLARQFASLDHMSNGRIGWNIVTTWLAGASGNYGLQEPLSHEERYQCAERGSRSAAMGRSAGPYWIHRSRYRGWSACHAVQHAPARQASLDPVERKP